jgi:hypothetical protein
LPVGVTLTDEVATKTGSSDCDGVGDGISSNCVENTANPVVVEKFVGGSGTGGVVVVEITVGIGVTDTRVPESSLEVPD